MTLTTYWDLDPDERAALTEDEVRRYCDLHLMIEGIRKPEEPEHLDETPVELGTETFYAIAVEGRYSSDDHLDIVFTTAEAAAEFLRMSVRRYVNDYSDGKYSQPLRNPKVVPIELPTEGERSAHKAELDRVAANKRTNETAQREYREAVKKCDEAVAGIWDDFRDRQRQQARIEEVRRCWATYLSMANDDRTVARSFLEKAYPPEWWECDGHDVDLVQRAIGNLGKVEADV